MTFYHQQVSNNNGNRSNHRNLNHNHEYNNNGSAGRVPSSEDDEENEEIMRANANIMRNNHNSINSNSNHNINSKNNYHHSHSHNHNNYHHPGGAGSDTSNQNNPNSNNKLLYPTKNASAVSTAPAPVPAPKAQVMDTSKSAADNWKGIGNRHMASQEYEEAYKAYSTALSISPLGPSSHIYLSNRAASLLSLKRYSAASVDARRAITLAPTFGKAHARLGQSLYFLKDYAGAVAAYENAFQFEPDNQVTWTYLNKARRKFEKEGEKRRRMEEERIDELVNAGVGAGAGASDGRNRQRERGDGGADGSKGGSRGGDSNRQYVQREQQKVYQQQQVGGGEEYYEKEQQEEKHGLRKAKEGGRLYEYDGDGDGNQYDGGEKEDDTTTDGASISDSVKFSVTGESTAVKDRAAAVLSTDHDHNAEGDDIDQLVAAVDRGETSIVRGKLQAALDSSDVHQQGHGRQSSQYYNSNDSINNDSINEEVDVTGEAIDDPDFDEALRLQEVAAIKLVNKEYRGAVEEFSAALFLVPDDTNLTPQLYIGRAHALNGLQRHEGALNDSMMALGRNPELPEAHVVLARTYFYVKNFSGAVASFEDAKDILKERGLGDQLSPLDELYYEKAIENSKQMGDTEFDEEKSYRSLALHSDKPIPKLRPPRFVSRQELLNSTSNVPPMPKAFSNQIPSLPATLRVGEERQVLFVSEAMGIKLNRGQDGIIRVLSVAPETPSSKHTRRGEINPGDIIREAAGVDLRRPLTNIMWSDTVALMKISPRPLEIIVAKELSERPPAVEEEFMKVGIKSPRRRRRPDPPNGFDPPSRASGMEPVSKALTETNNTEGEVINLDESISNEDLLVPFPRTPREHEDSVKDLSSDLCGQVDSEKEGITKNSVEEHDEQKSDDHVPIIEGEELAETKERTLSEELNMIDTDKDEASKEAVVPNIDVGSDAKAVEGSCATDVQGIEDIENHTQTESERSFGLERNASERLEVLKTFLDKDIIFTPVEQSDPLYEQTKGFTNTKWLAESGARKFIACGDVFVFEQSRSFWKSSQFVPRTLALYSDLLLVGRAPKNAAEIRSSLSDPSQPDIFAGMNDSDLIESFLIAEYVIDLNTCKLRRSMLTTPSSVVDETKEDEYAVKNTEISELCFELLAPTQNLFVSAQNPNDATSSKNSDRHLGDNKGLFLTTQWEESIKDALCALHTNLHPGDEDDKSWIHQCILGTLHSHVVSGNYSLLEKALTNKGDQKSPYPGIDDVDEDGLTALHHACFCRSHIAVTVLLNAGANCSKPTLKNRETPCHISAEQLDAKSLSMILSQSLPTRPDPNAINANGHTPMTVAVIKGRSPGGTRNPSSLNMCVASLQAWGGRLHVSYSPHPIFTLSSEWCYEELDIVFPISDCKFPVIGNGMEGYSKSLAALYDYPLHTCLIALRQKISKLGGTSRIFPPHIAPHQSAVVRTLETLLNCGFEPNERVEIVNDGTNALNEMIGYTPVQILAAAALDLLHKIETSKCSENDADVKTITSIIASSAECLVTKGARLSVDQPWTERFNDDKKLPIKSPLKSPMKQKQKTLPKSEENLILRYINSSEINFEKSKELMKILDANDSLAKCESKWHQTRVVKGTGQIHFLQGKGLSIKIENCKLAGGSDEKNCALCWKKFGSLRNRKHICRASRRYVCEDCSSKTLLLDGDGRRITDGQFNLAKCKADRKEEQDRINFDLKKKERKSRIQEAWAKSHGMKNPLQAAQKDESSAKEELFGGVGRAVKNFFMEEVEVEDPQDIRANDRGVSGVMSSLSQTGEAFRERGEKLNTLVEKTDKLKNASEDFAKMARELKESQQKGLFW